MFTMTPAMIMQKIAVPFVSLWNGCFFATSTVVQFKKNRMKSTISPIRLTISYPYNPIDLTAAQPKYKVRVQPKKNTVNISAHPQAFSRVSISIT